ncbi:uncharacterized protein LOC117294583 [Asterias rubens]|uniref:uncharacterized protein LOC117294583 n=1 Tax=Asterias rubens TaxID=7604 RepID=UPI001455A8FE|nr:uncharacterized protein LOC117294583 [Asterias rubens]
MSFLFEPLPTLQEDEELVSITDILGLRRGRLRENEMWAVCKETILALDAFRSASFELFSKLYLCPDTLAFDSSSRVCFIDTDVLDTKYRPPEYTERKGTTLKGHLYSLARTLLDAADHCLPDEDNEAEISQPLFDLITELSTEDPKRRPGVAETVKTCERNLDDPSTLVCRRLSAVSRRKLSIDSCYDFPVNEEALSTRRRSSVLFSRGRSLSNGSLQDTLSPSDVYKNPSSPSPPRLISGQDRAPAALIMSGERRFGNDEEGENLREAPTAAALNILSQRAQDILKKIYSANENGSGSRNCTNGGISTMEKSHEMRRHSSVGTVEGKYASGASGLKRNSEPNGPFRIPPNTIPEIKVLSDDRSGGTISGENSPTPNSVKVSAALARFLKSRKQPVENELEEQGEMSGVESSASPRDGMGLEVRYESADDTSGSTEPLSPLGMEDLSLLEGGMILDDPWLDDDESDVGSPVEFQRTLRSHSIAAFNTFEPRSSAFRMNKSSSTKSSRSSLENINENPHSGIGAKTKSDLITKRSRRRTESMSGSELCYSSIQDLNKLQDFFANRRSSIADFRLPGGLTTKATHFTPIVVTDEKAGSNKSLPRSTSTPSVEETKAKARAAMEAIKMDLKAPRNPHPPANMLESLENDAIASARASPCSSPNNLSSSLVDSNHNGCRDTGQPRTKTSERGQSALSKTTHEISNTESLSRQTNPERTKHELKTMQVDKRKFSLELEAITLKGSSQTDQRNISRDSTSSGESRVQKPKVKVVHGSPITRDSAFSPIQKPPRQEQQESQVTHKPDQIQPIIKDGHNDQKESVASSVLVNKIPTVDQNTCKSPKIPTNQLVAGAQTPLTTQSPAFASATQNTLLGQMSPLRLASPQALYPSVNQPLGQPLGAGATVPSFPLKVQLQQDPTTGLFHVLPVDLSAQAMQGIHGSPVISQGLPACSQGSPVVSQGSPAVFQGSPAVFQGSPAVSQESPAVFQGSPASNQGSNPQAKLEGNSSVSQGAGFVNEGAPVTTRTSTSAKTSDQTSGSVTANNERYWMRLKSPGASSDGESTCIPLSPEIPRRDAPDRKRDQIKKRTEKTKHLVSPSKRSLAKGSLYSESESSESSYLETLRLKNSPKGIRKKPTKPSSSQSDPDRMRDRNHDRSKSHSHDRSDKPQDSKSRSKSCERVKPLLSLYHKADPESALCKHQEKSGSKGSHSSTRNHVSHRPSDHHKVSKKPGYSTEDVDDSRPVDASRHAPSPISMSRDSGVNLRYSMSSGEELTTVSEVQQLANVLQGNSSLKRVIKLIRQAFAYDGYLENGIEDLAMAEYITALGKLSWQTFNNAVTEKFCDLYWEEELLEGLYEVVNGQKPPSKPASNALNKNRSEVPKKPLRSKQSMKGSHLSAHRKETADRKTQDSKLDDPTAKKKFPQTSTPIRNKDGTTGKSRVTGERSRVHGDGRQVAEVKNTEKEHRRKHDERSGRTKVASPESDSTEQGQLSSNENRRESHSAKRETGLVKSNRTSSRSNSSASESRTKVSRPPEHDLKEASLRSRAQATKEIGNATLPSEEGDLTKGTADKLKDENSSGDGLQRQRRTAAVVSQNDHKKEEHQNRKEVDRLQYASTSQSDHNTSVESSVDLNASKVSLASSNASSSIISQGKSVTDDSLNASLTSSQFTSPSILNSPLFRNNSDSSDSTNRKIREMLSRRGSQGSISSASSGQSRSLCNNSDTISLPSLSSFNDSSMEESRCGLPGGVLYRGESVDPSVEAYTQQLTGAGLTQQNIDTKIADVEQQLMMERRMRNKTEKFYRKLVNNQQTNKGADQKHMVSKVGKQILEMSKRVEFLESAKRHLEMLYAEQWGLDLSYLFSLASSYGKTTMDLRPSDTNPLLSFQTGRNKLTLQAGQSLGLFSFLYARHALLQGYLHHFFYTYHYYTTSEELFGFILKTSVSALGMNVSNAEHQTKIVYRTLDVLQVWVEGFYEVDFRPNQRLLQDVLVFITDKIIPVDSQGQCLIQLIEKLDEDRPGTSLLVASQRDEILDQLPMDKASASRSLLGKTGRGKLKAGIMSCLTKKDSSKQQADSSYLPTVSMEKEGFSLSDHTSMSLAHQLTLIQQELFHHAHPVHFLNSRSKGIGVNTNNFDGTGGKGQFSPDGADAPNLFVRLHGEDRAVRALLHHAKEVSHWVSAEVVSCSSAKSQLVLLCKFINVAKTCYDLRNFASCVQILDSLDNVIVRQVPAWRNLPSKVVSLYEELCASKVHLQGDGDSLIEGDAHKGSPTLPPTLLLLMHVQQLEIGGFQLPNGMYKWSKMRSIAKFVDQIRTFKEHAFNFDSNQELQDLLKVRILECCDQDIHVLAARHSSNFHQLTSDKSSRRLQNAFQKVRATLH